MASYQKIKEYFSLLESRPVLGGSGSEQHSQAWLFIGVVLGAIAKVVYDLLVNGGAVGWKPFLIALIVSIVVFPQLYYSGGLNRRKLSFAHWTFAFQNGFFWSTTFDALSK
ncbi:MAG: hypothetical protein JNJ50_16190 [Acidobacteria bacterium]|nr:hypothetical protein [Acidobacteriota bacterium]